MSDVKSDAKLDVKSDIDQMLNWIYIKLDVESDVDSWGSISDKMKWEWGQNKPRQAKTGCLRCFETPYIREWLCKRWEVQDLFLLEPSVAAVEMLGAEWDLAWALHSNADNFGVLFTTSAL